MYRLYKFYTSTHLLLQKLWNCSANKCYHTLTSNQSVDIPFCCLHFYFLDRPLALKVQKLDHIWSLHWHLLKLWMMQLAPNSEKEVSQHWTTAVNSRLAMNARRAPGAAPLAWRLQLLGTNLLLKLWLSQASSEEHRLLLCERDDPRSTAFECCSSCVRVDAANGCKTWPRAVPLLSSSSSWHCGKHHLTVKIFFLSSQMVYCNSKYIFHQKILHLAEIQVSNSLRRDIREMNWAFSFKKLTWWGRCSQVQLWYIDLMNSLEERFSSRVEPSVAIFHSLMIRSEVTVTHRVGK